MEGWAAVSSELKACPFCGADDGYQAATRIDHNRGAWLCHVCNARGPTADRPTMGSDAKPMEAWNRRTPSPAVRALVEACKGLVPTLRSGDWGNQDETADEIDKAIGAVEREIGGA